MDLGFGVFRESVVVVVVVALRTLSGTDGTLEDWTM
jgi:hypothetical protein